MEPVNSPQETAGRDLRRYAEISEEDFERVVDEVAGRAWWALTGEQAVRAGEAGFQAMRRAIRDALGAYFSRRSRPSLKPLGGETPRPRPQAG